MQLLTHRQIDRLAQRLKAQPCNTRTLRLLAMGLRALSLGVLVLALAIAVGQHQGLIPPERLQAVLEQPAVARAVDRLRSLPLVQRLYGALPAGCSCGVSLALEADQCMGTQRSIHDPMLG